MNFTTFTTSDKEVNRLQLNCQSTFMFLLNNPFNKIVLLENVVLGSSSVAIEHKLGYKPKGYIIVKKEYDGNSPVDIKFEAISSNLEHLFIKLKSTAACTISLLIF